MRCPLLILIVASLVGAGCTSTPQHTNTLIFGTNTKFGADLSQDPTGSVGITVGYRRQEAVWMPLLANGSKDGNPYSCADKECAKFAGSAGAGGPAGENAIDTYSVLATFSGQASGEAQLGDAGKPAVKAQLAQYFATGFAARLLAASGSSVVNTAGTDTPAATVAASVVAENKVAIASIKEKVDKIMAAITATDGTIDSAKRDALFAKATALPANSKTAMKAMNAIDLRAHLMLTYDVNGKPLFEALP